MMELQSMWHWQPALYLFLGGLGAGAFVTAAVLFFKDMEGYRKTAGVSMWAAAACLVVGLLLLLSELVHPLRGLMMWQSFANFSSWMAVGAWILFAAVVVFVAAAALVSDASFRLLSKISFLVGKRKALSAFFVAVGLVLGLLVAAYTGVLLMKAPGIALWNTPLLPLLFTVSALDTGVALVEIVAVVLLKDERLAHKARKMLEVAVIVLVVAELFVLYSFAQAMLAGNMGGAAYNGSMAEAAMASIGVILSGDFAGAFWVLVIGCGLALPLACAVAGLMVDGKRAKAVSLVGALGALAGGCALRFIIVYAGAHADIVLDAVSKIVF